MKNTQIPVFSNSLAKELGSADSFSDSCIEFGTIRSAKENKSLTLFQIELRSLKKRRDDVNYLYP